MASHLSGGKVNVALVQELAKKELLRLLTQCDGSKAIVWDKSLAGPVGLIAKYHGLLRENEVVKMFPLGADKLPRSNVKNLIFITRPQLELMDLVAKHVLAEVQSGGSKKELHLFFVPRRSKICEKWLMALGVFGSFTFIEEFKCDLFPFDSDLMSMELENTFKECHLEKDPGSLHHVAQAVSTLQDLFGAAAQVCGLGAAARRVWDLACRVSPRPAAPPLLDRLLLLDRAVDLLTPLATQLTYEGLVDEVFGINNTTAQFPAARFKADDDSGEMPLETKQIILNSADELFAELRDKNFNAVGPALSRKARLISSQFEERHGEKTVQEMKQFVARLPHMMAAKASLAVHTTIAELVKEFTDSDQFLESLQTEQEFMNAIDTDKIHPYIEDCIAQKIPLIKVLRLVCMQSVTNSGLKAKVLEHYKREIIQTYGFQHILTLSNLEVAGLLRLQGARQYTILRKTLRLTVEDGSEVQPTDISYVHSVYAPLSVRLAQHLARPGGWRSLQDVLGLLGVPSFQETQRTALGRRDSVASQSSQTDVPKVVLVFFIAVAPCVVPGDCVGSQSSQTDVPKVVLEFFIAVAPCVVPGDSVASQSSQTDVPKVVLLFFIAVAPCVVPGDSVASQSSQTDVPKVVLLFFIAVALCVVPGDSVASQSSQTDVPKVVLVFFIAVAPCVVPGDSVGSQLSQTDVPKVVLLFFIAVAPCVVPGDSVASQSS
ncbi:vacuolar protein sorting-associated protein 33A isoform X2 [Bacillus rossius redtenbacheri]|uniref:vacuolar protein sorting-associated protein 33A isoform X2 n=1 Tax=Bacillus rossius redtenbacheri TaxID=93214 RepID=UPI002FDC811C